MRARIFFFAFCVAGCLARSGQAEWVDATRIGQFRVYSEFSLDRYEGLLATLPEQRSDVAATLGLKPTRKPIVICLFASHSSYVRYVSEHAPTGIDRQALFVRGEDAGFVYVYRHPKFEADLRHESTHAILHSMLPFLPLWLDEGLAEYFEVQNTKRASSNPHQMRMKWAARLGWKPNLSRLEDHDDLSQFSAADYRESWAWTHFLLHGSKEGNTLLKRYLATIQAERPPGPLSKHLNRTIENANRALINHLKRWK